MHRYIFWICLFVSLNCLGFAHPKIYDCFIFFNELDLLEVRLNELYDHVDKFVLVEATETFKGHPKELHYFNNRERFSKFSDKIIHVIVSLPRANDERTQYYNYVRENFQRNQIMQGLVDCSDDDIVFISDVDEIPRNSVISPAVEKLIQKECDTVGLRLKHYRYFIDRYEMEWYASGATTYRYLKTIDPTIFRLIITGWGETRQYSRPSTIDKAGWHFTTMGGNAKVKEKIDAFSHVEGGHHHWSTDPNVIDTNIRNETAQVSIDSTYPKFIQDNVDYFKQINFIYK